MKVLSVIIPTYNMEEYLKKCLSSLVIPSLDKVEVIIINDGSTDSSSEIAHGYEKTYPNSFRVIDKENGNYGSCINRGLKESKGKYIKVLDADDYFVTENSERMVRQLEHLDVDLFLSSRIQVYSDGEEQCDLPYKQGKIIQAEEAFSKKSFEKISMHDVSYRRDILIELSYHQLEGVFYTDNLWIYYPMAKVKTLYYFNQPVYCYLLAREGQSVSPEVMMKHLKDELIVVDRMVDDYEKMVSLAPNMQSIFYFKLYRRILSIYKRLLVKLQIFDNKELREFDCQLKQKSQKLYHQLGHELLSSPLLCFRYISIWRKNPLGMMMRNIIKLYHTKKRLFG